MKPTLFISYSHDDEAKHLWLQRLKTFLDGVKDKLPLDVWGDDRIGVGETWREQIDSAISQAAVAVLIVGPGFLASNFIKENELPKLLQAKEANTLRLYPFVVGYVPWKYSVLEPLQAFNDPQKPLEGMAEPEQNKWLNDLVLAILDDMPAAKTVTWRSASTTPNLHAAIAAIMEHLEVTRKTFVAQAHRRNDLRRAMQARLEITEQLQHEKFFFRYYDQMNSEEKFEFNQIRGLTEGLHDSNRAMLEIIQKNPGVRDELPILAALKVHLLVWLNKYDQVFTKTEQMPLLYVGVEDGVPFPLGVDEAVAEWLDKNRE